MNDMWLWLGRIFGTAGLLLCVVGGLARVAGNYWLGIFQVGTLLVGGTALMVAGCFFLLLVATRRDR